MNDYKLFHFKLSNMELQEESKKDEPSQRSFSDYKVMRIIGTGTFGKVYLALLQDNPVALKALKKSSVISLK